MVGVIIDTTAPVIEISSRGSRKSNKKQKRSIKEKQPEIPVNKKPDFIPHPNVEPLKSLKDISVLSDIRPPSEPEWKKTASKIPEIPIFNDIPKEEEPIPQEVHDLGSDEEP